MKGISRKLSKSLLLYLFGVTISSCWQFTEWVYGMRQLEVENQLRDVVSRIIVQVELATSQGRTDINLALEDAFIPILKSIYNLPSLINLNRKQKNFPGIDL